jgi:SNF2 family DNA or RNA helicase
LLILNCLFELHFNQSLINTPNRCQLATQPITERPSHLLYFKVLLFSQSLDMLSLFESFLTTHSLKYLRMDGSTPVGSRLKLVDKFNVDEGIFCMLLSTRVGGVGVNLTG